ncbi:hypothetical protein [Escherichia sp. E5028]|uniref:hypothetical protein n=1 Tax=Escherichia sp. E5028 TaxID=2044602 RepID=UPI00107F561B|nr:hypothetical protein [Escherichia sp. E5028]
MLTEKRRRGPPKSPTPPLSAKERARRYRNKVKEKGGCEIRTYFDANELNLFDHVRKQWNLPLEATHADIIRAMVVVLGGHTLITTGKRVNAAITINDVIEVEDLISGTETP